MFYDIFKELCEENGVTPAKVARDVGIAQSAVAMWKKRGSTPNATTLVQLAEYFHTTPAYLTGNSAARCQDDTLGTDDSLKAVVIGGIPGIFHSEIFQKLREIGIPMEKIVRESKHGAFIGEGFIVEELTPEEQLRVVNAINEVVFRNWPDRRPPPFSTIDEIQQQTAPLPVPDKDPTPPADAPEEPPEGE